MALTLLLCLLGMLFGPGVRGQTEDPFVEPLGHDYPGDYIILAPNAAHAGLPFSLSVQILHSNASTVTVTATILNTSTPSITESKVFNFDGGASGIITLEMPSDAPAGEYQLQVAGSGGLEFLKTEPLTVYHEGFAILVQSDKAIYKPGQTIMFRAMAVYPDLKPYLGMFDIEMKDPDGNIVKQWNGLENTEFGVVSGEMFMSDAARLGDWIIKVTANEQEFEHVVEVSEYVLPKFEVKLILPPYTSSADKEIIGMVEAKYTYGKPVSGTATVSIRVRSYYYYFDDTQPSIIKNNIKVDGTGDIRIARKEFEDAFDIDIDELSGEFEIIFDAEVTESLTGIKQDGSGSIPFSQHPIKITEVTGNPDSFKPGLTYTAYMAVTHLDGSPLTEDEKRPGIEVTLTKNYENKNLTVTNYAIPANGIVKVEFIPQTGAMNYNLKVGYKEYVPQAEEYCSNCLSKYLESAESPTDTFLQITSETNDLTAGDTATFNILTTEVPGKLQYQIVSRGNILLTDSVNAPETATLLEFLVTSKMAPSPRLIVSYLKDDGEVILASINFKVNGVFENDVQISASLDKVAPGQEVSLDIKAAADSFIGILAIDQSVRLLKTGNDITQDQVIQALDEFDTASSDDDYFDDGFGRPIARRRRSVQERSKRSIWCPWCWFPVGGLTVGDVIDNAGMLVFTNGQIYENPFGGDVWAFGPPILAAAPVDAFAEEKGAPEDDAKEQTVDINDRYWLFEAAEADFDGGDAIERNEPGVIAIGEDTKGSSSKTRIRTEFPETWLWADYEVDSSGNLQVTSKVPDTITSWVASAFGMSSSLGLGVADPTAKIQVFQNFFVSLNLPYSVVRGELLAVQVTVFNYMDQDVTAEITLVKSTGFDAVKVLPVVDKTGKDSKNDIQYEYESKDQVISAKIPANDGVTVSFPIKPKKLGMVDLTVKANSNLAADAITQPLLVEPEGVAQTYTQPLFIDLEDTPSVTQEFVFDLPTVENGLVEGSVRGVITATGDIMGPTINGLDKLLALPSGCGEQNMVNFAPDVFIYKYLSSTNQDNTAIKEKAKKFMETGHSRELEYQHKEEPNVGAFSAFGDSDENGSTWLSAFVIKSFVQAAPYIYINFPKVVESIDWVLAQQTPDGYFDEPGRVIHTNMQGRVDSELTMTAYVLISLQEVLKSNEVSQMLKDVVQRASDKAVAYLEDNKNTIKSDTYKLALATYALTMANSNIKDELKMALDSKAMGEGGVKYWSTGDGTTSANENDMARYFYQGPPSADVEMTGYALLAYLERGTREDFAAAAGIAKWLTQQRNSYGGYSSTQDTVIGLQALSEYASQLNSVTRDISISISATDNAADAQELTINEDNSVVYQIVELMSTTGSINVQVSGEGNCLIQFSVDYNLDLDNVIKDFDFTVKVIDVNRNQVNVQLCGSYVGDQEKPGMGIINTGVFSGFEASEDELKKTVNEGVNIARHESSPQGVTFYLNDIGTRTCATVALQRTKPVASTQPTRASMYRYYKPDNQVVQIYNSKSLAETSICEVCGSNCENCSDPPPCCTAASVTNSILVLLLSALMLVFHKFV